MANVTDEIGIYDDAGTPQERHCIANVTFDNVTRIVSRIENWENTYPFDWLLEVPGVLAQPIRIPANSTRANRLNVTGSISIDAPWRLTRAP